MSRIQSFCLICMLVLPVKLPGQDAPLVFSGEFENASFADFAAVLEEQTGVSIYYRESWVRDIRVSLSGSGLPLLPTLDAILGPRGIRFFLDDWDHLFLTDSISLLEVLPAYAISVDPAGALVQDKREKEAIPAEQSYINGRKTLVPETIHVGSGALVPGGKRVLINGRIEDVESGEPLMGATLYIEEIRKGTSTNLDGMFNLVLQTGNYEVECKSMGMEPIHFRLAVHSEGELNLTMKRTLIPLDEVVVRADRYDNVSGTQMGFERLNYKVLKEVPLLMGERDIINVVKLLPGVQSVGEGSAGFNVRGSGVDQNMIYIDKVPVYNSSHLFGFFTSFSPEIVSDFMLYKSSLPASFGGRLASFFDIRTKQGNMKRFAARGGISTVSAYAAVEAPIKKDRSSFILSGRLSYSDWILGLLEDPDLRNSDAGFGDISGAFTQKIGEHSRIRAFAYLSRDHFQLASTNTYDYGNTGGSIDLAHRFNQQTTGNLTFVYSRYQFRNSDMEKASAAYQNAYQVNHYELKSDFKWLSLGRHILTFGASGIYYHLDRGSIEPYGDYSLQESLDLGVENGIELAIYGGDEITLTERLTTYLGLRISSYMVLGPSEVRTYMPGMPALDENVRGITSYGGGDVIKSYLGLEPRVNLRYMTGNTSSVKLSYNRGYQYLYMLSNTIAPAPTDQWHLCNYHIQPLYLDQLSLGYYKDISGKGLSTSLEVYRKWGHNIVEYRDGGSFSKSPFVESETLQGGQDAYGIETMVRKNAGPLTGWMSYTYARSFIQVDHPVTGEQINEGMRFPSNYDRPHSFNLVANYKRGRKVSLSANLVYMTGRPATYPVSVYYEYGIPYVHYSDRNSYRIPNYFRLDVSMNVEGNLRKNKLFHSFWMLSVYNVTGRDNAYSVYFKNLDGRIKGYKLSIFAIPIFTVSWNVKLGNYATE